MRIQCEKHQHTDGNKDEEKNNISFERIMTGLEIKSL